MKAKSERKVTTYSVVVENPNSWNASTGIHETTAECGHEHKTMDAAEKCMAKLTRSYCNHGHVAGTPCHQCLGYAQSHSTSARWYHAQVRTNYSPEELARLQAEYDKGQKLMAKRQAYWDSLK